jgi:hypothetical protein
MTHKHIQRSVSPFFWTVGCLFLKPFQSKHFQEFLQPEKIIQWLNIPVFNSFIKN